MFHGQVLTCCYFCELCVFDFGRSIFRDHKTEIVCSNSGTKMVNQFTPKNYTSKQVSQSYYISNQSLLICDWYFGFIPLKFLSRYKKSVNISGTSQWVSLADCQNENLPSNWNQKCFCIWRCFGMCLLAMLP